MLTLTRAFAFAVSTALCAATAGAQQVEVIFCEIPTSPKSIVPGALDLAGAPAVTNFKSFEDLWVSDDDALWIVRGRTQQGPDLENILVRGSHVGGFSNFAQEGQPIPGGAPGELYEFFGSATGRFNGLNQFAYSARARGGLASVFQKVLVWDGTSTTLVMQMGDLYTGLIDLLPNPSGDETIGNSIGSIHLLDDGTIGSQDSTIQNIHTSRRPALFYDSAAFQQNGVTTVIPLGGGSPVVWTGLDANEFYTSYDGAHWVAGGKVGTVTTSDEVLAYDGTVVLQEGAPVPGSSLVLGTILDGDITGQGTWYARGRDNSGTTSAAPDWFVRQGTLIAQTGDPITPTEDYGNTFLAIAVNDSGDWALAANTSSANLAADQVLVLNGTVLLREGDPVDVDGNGVFDDGAFIGRGDNTLAAFGADKLQLTSTGAIYLVANLNDGMGNDLNSSPVFGSPDALLRIGGCDAPVVYCTAKVNSQGCTPQVGSTGTPSASAGSGFTVTATSMINNKNCLLLYGVDGRAATPFQGGILCVHAQVKRTPGTNTFGNPPPNDCSGHPAIDMNLFAVGGLGGSPLPALTAAGTVVDCQWWGRDPGIAPPNNTQLTDALEYTVCP